MPDPDAVFTLKQSVFNQVLTTPSVLGVPDMVLDVDETGRMNYLEFQTEKMIHFKQFQC